MLLAWLLDISGGFLTLFGTLLVMMKYTRPHFWESLKKEEKYEGDLNKILVIVFFFGSIMLLAGLSLGLK